MRLCNMCGGAGGEGYAEASSQEGDRENELE
jgi:Na+-translocating ferredoxin:NAD+ oxidoreductase RNF subunit RnfB